MCSARTQRQLDVVNHLNKERPSKATVGCLKVKDDDSDSHDVGAGGATLLPNSKPSATTQHS